jgi:hypothetical protein
MVSRFIISESEDDEPRTKASAGSAGFGVGLDEAARGAAPKPTVFAML